MADRLFGTCWNNNKKISKEVLKQGDSSENGDDSRFLKGCRDGSIGLGIDRVVQGTEISQSWELG